MKRIIEKVQNGRNWQKPVSAKDGLKGK